MLETYYINKKITLISDTECNWQWKEFFWMKASCKKHASLILDSKCSFKFWREFDYVVTSYKFSSGSAAVCEWLRKYLIAVITLGNFARKVSLRRAREPGSNFILISAPLSSEAVLASNVTFLVGLIQSSSALF